MLQLQKRVGQGHTNIKDKVKFVNKEVYPATIEWILMISLCKTNDLFSKDTFDPGAMIWTAMVQNF